MSGWNTVGWVGMSEFAPPPVYVKENYAIKRNDSC